MSDQYVHVPRELLERINRVAFLPVALASDLWDVLAAPAEDVSAVVEEPVMRLDCEKLWGGDGEYAVDFVKPGWLDECRKKGGTFLLYCHPQRQLAPQCSEVTSQCSEHLRTQAKLFPNSTIYPRPPRHTGFLLPEREEPGYTLEQMQAYVADCIKAFIKQNK